MGDLTIEFKLNCNHIFCRSCLTEYVKDKINNYDITEINCPNGINNCVILIDENVIQNLTEKIFWVKYNKIKKRNFILNNNNYIICPYPDCDSYGKLNENVDNSSQNIFCVGKKHEFCTICKRLAHYNMNCDSLIEYELMRNIRDYPDVKKCPKCKFYIQKNQGCNHMTCGNKICKYEFCWICLGSCEPGHFSNIFSKCHNLQNLSQNSIFMKYTLLLHLKWFVYFFVIIIGIPLLFLSVPLIFFISLFFNLIKANNKIIHFIIKFIAIFTYLCLGFVTVPLTILILIFGSIVTMIGFMIYCIVKFIRMRLQRS